METMKMERFFPFKSFDPFRWNKKPKNNFTTLTQNFGVEEKIPARKTKRDPAIRQVSLSFAPRGLRIQ